MEQIKVGCKKPRYKMVSSLLTHRMWENDSENDDHGGYLPRHLNRVFRSSSSLLVITIN